VLIRWLAAVVAFLATAFVGIVGFGNFTEGIDPELGYDVAGANSFALILAIGLVVAFIVYAAAEYAQTRALTSISRQFDTRTIVLIPIAIAINIILGQAVAAALKLPIYMDSIGTILVGALAGPIPGALTGFAANLIWTYVLPAPFHSDFAAPFALVAAVIGLLAGAFSRVGWLRPRPDRTFAQLAAGAAVALVVVGGLAWYAYIRFYGEGLDLFGAAENFLFTILQWVVVLVIVAAVVGFLGLLFWRRDLTVAYVVVGGVVTGIIAALISAPISANLFSGVTGSGTDFLVAAFRSAGSSIQEATFQQGLLSDPIDKLVTFLVVYIILSAMARRTKARFPQGELLVEGGGDDADWAGSPA
jgi:energy-coupling factor transport system substrate-specific component